MIKNIQNLLIVAAAEIADKKLEDNRIEFFYLPKKIINQLESAEYIDLRLLNK